MDNIIKKALSIRGWRVDFSSEHDTYYRMINGILACVTIHARGIRYRLKGMMEIVIMYDEISIINGRYLIHAKGNLLIDDKG